MSWIVEHLLMFSKGFFTGFVYNFAALSTALFVTDILINQGKFNGFIAAVGLTMTHIFWAIISAYALSFAFLNLDKNIYVYTFTGSLILFYFAFYIYLKKPKKKNLFLLNRRSSSEKIYLEATVFGLASPEKIVGYAALFAVVNIPTANTLIMDKIPLVLGVGVGSFVWWAIYIFCVNKKISAISSATSLLLKKISAYSLAILGLAGIVTALVEWR